MKTVFERTSFEEQLARFKADSMIMPESLPRFMKMLAETPVKEYLFKINFNSFPIRKTGDMLSSLTGKPFESISFGELAYCLAKRNTADVSEAETMLYAVFASVQSDLDLLKESNPRLTRSYFFNRYGALYDVITVPYDEYLEWLAASFRNKRIGKNAEQFLKTYDSGSFIREGIWRALTGDQSTTYINLYAPLQPGFGVKPKSFTGENIYSEEAVSKACRGNIKTDLGTCMVRMRLFLIEPLAAMNEHKY